MADFAPGTAEITKAGITTRDGTFFNIVNLITAFSLGQSMTSISLMGSITVIDGVGMLESAPLRGEELLEISLTGSDFDTIIDLRAQIYKIDGVSIGAATANVSYTLHFITAESWNASKRKIIKPYTNISSSAAAEDVFRTYFDNIKAFTPNSPAELKETLSWGTTRFTLQNNITRKFVIQPSVGQLKAIIPNLSPASAMNFLAARSFSNESISNSYRFFETVDGYYFVTDEWLIDFAVKNSSNIIPLKFNATQSKEPTAAESQVQSILTISQPTRVDTGADLFSGGYTNRVWEIDLVRRVVEDKQYSYINGAAAYTDMSGTKRSIGDDIHTKEFIEETFTVENASRSMIIRDYAQSGKTPGILRQDQHYAEIISNRKMHSHHMEQTAITITMRGRLDIRPGQIVEIDAQNFSADRKGEDNEQLSGNYLVKSTAHNLSGTDLNLSAQLIKYGWT